MKSLMRLETWIETLVEEPFVRLFAGQLLPQDVALHLARALEDAETTGSDGQVQIPGRFAIALHPEDLRALRQLHPDLETSLAASLRELMGRLQVRLTQAPEVVLAADATLPPRGVHIRPMHTVAPCERTQELSTAHGFQTPQKITRTVCEAYVIIDGNRVVDLLAPQIRLGRALDNDLIFEDPRVSRHHAQLQQRYGRFVLQDLSSRGGTWVNGFRIQEVVLRSGDVISLAGVELIYAEQNGSALHAPQPGDTRPNPPKEA